MNAPDRRPCPVCLRHVLTGKLVGAHRDTADESCVMSGRLAPVPFVDDEAVSA